MHEPSLSINRAIRQTVREGGWSDLLNDLIDEAQEALVGALNRAQRYGKLADCENPEH